MSGFDPRYQQQHEQPDTEREDEPQSEQQQSGSRPQKQSDSDALKQAKDDALTPEQKHQNYLDDLERLHKESVVDSLGHTPRAG